MIIKQIIIIYQIYLINKLEYKQERLENNFVNTKISALIELQEYIVRLKISQV